jgi:hypothetical protein
VASNRPQPGLWQGIPLLMVFVGAAVAGGALSGLYAEELGSARLVVMLAPIFGLGRVLQVVWTARRQLSGPAAVVPDDRSTATGAIVVMAVGYVAVLGGVVVLLARYSGGLGLGRTMRSVVIALVVSICAALMMAFMLKRVESWRRSQI